MSNSTLVLHRGSKEVNRDELALVPVPRGTATWYPVGHNAVLDEVERSLNVGGFAVKKSRYGLSQDGSRMFTTLDIGTALSENVTLAVGVRNSYDKSLPLGFCAGSRVFVCDNLAFSSELLVKRRHTRHGANRFREAISLAVKELDQFREQESNRIKRMQAYEIPNVIAESLMLRAFEEKLLSNLTLPIVIREWRNPTHDEFKPRTAWSLFNACTTALNGRALSNPQQHADITMQLGAMLDSHNPVAV